MTELLPLIIGALLISMLLSTLRLARGPTLPNRVIALDVLASLAAGLTAVLALYFDEPVFLDVTIVLAVLSFMSTVAFAHYIEIGKSR